MTGGADNDDHDGDDPAELCCAGARRTGRYRGPPASAARRSRTPSSTAAYAELTEVGYTAFCVEGVAARARTGKASIYRRWPSKNELILDALCAHLPTPQQCGMDMAIERSSPPPTRCGGSPTRSLPS